MKEKYRWNFQESDKCCKDDMLWVFENFIVGVSDSSKHFVMNHYGKDFDKSNYVKVDMDYTLDKFYEEYFEWVFEEMEHWYL